MIRRVSEETHKFIVEATNAYHRKDITEETLNAIIKDLQKKEGKNGMDTARNSNLVNVVPAYFGQD